MIMACRSEMKTILKDSGEIHVDMRETVVGIDGR
jgi:hypothetical protein